MNEVEQLKATIKYLEDSLTAIITGHLPEYADLNQQLLALRGRAYNHWLESTKGINDSVKGA